MAFLFPWLARASYCAGAIASLLLVSSSAIADTFNGLPVVNSADSSVPPMHIAGHDKQIQYYGRFDITDPAGPRCSWSASTATVKFQASALDVDLNESGDGDEWEVIVDGAPAAILAPMSGEHAYRVFSADAPGVHTVTLVKRTEAQCGIAQFEGFDLSAGGKVLDPPKMAKRGIEVVGDSITCGYGNEAKDQNEHWSNTTEDAYESYGDITARALGARYACIAWSGRKMWPDFTTPSIYGLTLPTDPKSQWDFSRWKPDAVIINLGTNDFNQAKGGPDEKGWTSAYDAFIERVRSYYPKAYIYCATSPMMGGGQWQMEKRYLAEIVAAENVKGDKRVELLLVPTQDMQADGLGADWHPSVATHRKMAAQLEQALQKDLGWKPVTNAQ
jgi:lysophospholipase L1-like esterase